MDDLDQMVAWLCRRDSLAESAQYAAPEEQVKIDRDIKFAMRQVLVLLDKIQWEQVTPAA